MFDSDHTLTGKHATYTKHLNEAGVFSRYIDVYLNGAIFGFLNGRKAGRDNTSNDRGRIYADAFIKERTRCSFIYRLIMLLEETSGWSDQQRVDRAFREDCLEGAAKEANLELFHQYVRGGIEFLYEVFVNCSTRDDYVSRIYELVTDFKEELDGVPYPERLEEAMGDYIVG